MMWGLVRLKMGHELVAQGNGVFWRRSMQLYSDLSWAPGAALGQISLVLRGSGRSGRNRPKQADLGLLGKCQAEAAIFPAPIRMGALSLPEGLGWDSHELTTPPFH